MTPFTTTRINYSAITEADNKADRERQLQLKVSDEKRRKMKVILTENSMLRFNQLKNTISKDHAPILDTLKDSLLSLDSTLDKNIQPRVLIDHNATLNFENQLQPQEPLPIIKQFQSDQEISKVKANSSTSSDLLNIERVAIENPNLIQELAVDTNLIELAADDKSAVPDEATAIKSSSLITLTSNLEDIIDDIKSKKTSAEILCRIQDIERGMSQEIIESKNFSQSDLNDLSCQIDFLDGYLQSESYFKDIQNKLIESLNNSRNYLAQIENANLLQKESKSSSIENNPAILEDTVAMMSPLLFNPSSTSNKASIDNAANRNNQVNGTARLQQKNKEETLPLIVLKSI